MVTVAELRSIVRTQTQTDPGDLADSTIDVWLQQGYERTLNAETQWPFLATEWHIEQTAGETSLELPGNVNEPGIMGLWDTTNGVRMSLVPQIWAEGHFGWGNAAGTTASLLFSVWGQRINLWPAITFGETRQYILRGYRKPLNWIADGSPDCDPRLHMPISHFAVALAYAQQEDAQLEAIYMGRWQADVELARRAIMEPVHHRPLIMGGSVSAYYGSEFVPTGFIVTTPP